MNSIKFSIFVFFCLFISTENAVGQTKLIPALGYDYACFKNIDQPNETRFELYLSVFQNTISYVKQSTEAWKIRFEIKTSVISVDQNIVIENDSLFHEETTFSNPETSANSILLMQSFYIRPESYLLKIEITDQNNKQSNTYQVDLNIANFSSNELQTSDIFLAENIAPTDQSTVFTKYNREVIPNPLKLHSVNRPFLFYYFEIYNLSFDGEQIENNKYSITTSILDENGSVILTGDEKIRDKIGTSSVIFDKIRLHQLKDIQNLKTASNLKLRIDIKDLGTNQMVSAEKDFYYLRENKIDLAHQNQVLTEERLIEIYDEIKPIAKSGELDVFPQLSHDGKINLIKDFWKRRDPTPETAVNEFAMDYYNRLQYINEAFVEGQKKVGVNTDRGLIYLKYAAPTQINRHDHDINTKPYIEWIYFTDSRRVFIFANLAGFGRYRLIHSTWPGELSDEKWQERISIKPER